MPSVMLEIISTVCRRHGSVTIPSSGEPALNQLLPRHRDTLSPGNGRACGGVTGHWDGTQLGCVTLNMPKASVLPRFPSICLPT